jgi:hypothetical protein
MQVSYQSIGVVGLVCFHTSIHTMEVVEIWREAQSLYCAFYVFVDVCR